jgi:hypothetical protein
MSFSPYFTTNIFTRLERTKSLCDFQIKALFDYLSSFERLLFLLMVDGLNKQFIYEYSGLDMKDCPGQSNLAVAQADFHAHLPDRQPNSAFLLLFNTLDK